MSDRLVVQRVQDPSEAQRAAARIVASIKLPDPENIHDRSCSVSSPTLSVGIQGTRAIVATGASVFTLETREL